MGRKYGYKKGDLPVTEEISERMLRLPIHNNLNYNLIDFLDVFMILNKKIIPLLISTLVIIFFF